MLTLRFYSIAKVKYHDYVYQLSKHDTCNEIIEKEVAYYQHIIYTVDRWFHFLSLAEQDIITLRFLEHHTVDYVSGVLGYATHSSIVKQCKTIITTIKEKEMIQHDTVE